MAIFLINGSLKPRSVFGKKKREVQEMDSENKTKQINSACI
jgi:hypothetical protein